MNNQIKPFSEILNEHQGKNLLTNKEMADLLGISERMYAYYQKGEYDGNPAKVKKYLLKLSGNLQEDKPKGNLQDKYISTLEEQVSLQKDLIVLLKEKLKESLLLIPLFLSQFWRF